MLEDEVEEMGIKGVPTGNLNAGVGFIIIPKNVDVDLYKENVYRTGKVSMNGGYGYGDFHNVNVDREVLQRIKFPEKVGAMGSSVVWINMPKHNEPIIVACLKYDSDFHPLGEQKFKITRGMNNNLVDFDMDGKTGKITISAASMSKDYKSEIEIVLNSVNNDSRFKLKVNGDLILTSSGRQVNISNDRIETAVASKAGKVVARTVMNSNSVEGTDRFLYEDEFKNKININENEIAIKADNSSVIKFGEGKEPMVLGTTMKGKLDKIIEAMQKLTVPTAFGPSGTPVNISEFLAVKEEFDQFLSKLTNTD